MSSPQTIPTPADATVSLLVCPITAKPLHAEAGGLATPEGERHYPFTASGIPQFATQAVTKDGERQREHYDAVAENYIKNLSYPHTQEYMDYLDEQLLAAIGDPIPPVMMELCCGRGESFLLLDGRIKTGLGVDVSLAMLESARRQNPDPRVLFIQADATMLPVRNGACDLVMLLGGVHHVNDRIKLFQEIARVLKPGGRLIFREPVSDFFLWRAIRYVVYRLSPALDHETEAPLRHGLTQRQLAAAGLALSQWRTYGALGFCFFMNSDILVFNRLFRFIPGIRTITRAVARFDDWCTRVPGFRHGGLQVVACATKS